MHLTEVAAERLACGDLPPDELGRARAHVEECPACTLLLRTHVGAHASLVARLEVVDHEVPRVSARAVIERSRTRRRLSSRLVAAGIASLVVVTAAVAMANSPVRAWLRHRAATPAGQRRAESASVRAVPATGSGVSVSPGPAFDIAFDVPQESGDIRVTVGDEPTLSVRSPSRAVTFTVLPASIEVRSADASAEYDIHVPRALARLRIRVAGDVVFSKERDSVSTGGARDAHGVYDVDFARLRRRGRN